jgi:hypothetical protein
MLLFISRKDFGISDIIFGKDIISISELFGNFFQGRLALIIFVYLKNNRGKKEIIKEDSK